MSKVIIGGEEFLTGLQSVEVFDKETLNKDDLINDFEEKCGYSRQEAIEAANNVFLEDENY